MVEVTLTTGDVIKVGDVRIHVRKMTQPQECLYVWIPSIKLEESLRWNFEVFRSLENHIDYFGFTVSVRMALFEENIRRIINSIQMVAIGNALQLFYGMDTKIGAENIFLFLIFTNTIHTIGMIE